MILEVAVNAGQPIGNPLAKKKKKRGSSGEAVSHGLLSLHRV
jgi:hypothetical protein